MLVPDLLKGDYALDAWFPPDTPEKQQLIRAFMKNTSSATEPNVDALLRLRREVGDKWPAVEGHVVVGGLCWGGKIAVTACGEGNVGKGRRFNCIWTAHPG